MNILILGLGGIGSFLVDELADLTMTNQISPYTEFSVCDNDSIEIKNLSPYQNYVGINCVGLNKARETAKRKNDIFALNVFNPITERITKKKQLEKFDLIVMCVDNEQTRKLVIEFCFEKNRDFIDLRATGRKIFAMPKMKTLQENMKFVDKKDTKEYSCQDKKDLKEGLIQKGHKIVCMIGVQMIINNLRGHSNRVIAMAI